MIFLVLSVDVTFSNKHYLCISAPAMPLPPLEPMPGPGHYNVVDYEGPPKHYMSSSAFVSTTSRWSGGAPGEEDLPGPGKYIFFSGTIMITEDSVKHSSINLKLTW